MSGLASAIGKVLHGKKVANKKVPSPMVANREPTTKDGVSVRNAKLGDTADAKSYAKDPTNKKWRGVDPKKFGYPEDKTAYKPKKGIAVGNPKKVR